MQASLVAQMVKSLPTMRETWVQFLDWEDPLEKETAAHSSTLAWEIPWTEEPGGLQSMGSQRRTRLRDYHHIYYIYLRVDVCITSGGNEQRAEKAGISQQAIIRELSSEKSCCSAGNNQVDEQAGIMQHRWQLSRG